MLRLTTHGMRMGWERLAEDSTTDIHQFDKRNADVTTKSCWKADETNTSMVDYHAHMGGVQTLEVKADMLWVVARQQTRPRFSPQSTFYLQSLNMWIPK